MADERGILASIESLRHVYEQAQEAASSAEPMSDERREESAAVERELPPHVRTELGIVMNRFGASFRVGFDVYSFHRCAADDWAISTGFMEGKHYPYGSLRDGIVEYVALHKAGLLPHHEDRWLRTVRGADFGTSTP